MKTLPLSLLALSFLLLSCGPDRKKIQKDFVESCVVSAQQSFQSTGAKASAQTNQLMKEYCECSGEKIANGLTKEEIKAMEKDRTAISQQRLMELAKPCTDEFTQKMQEALAPRQMP